MEFEIARRPESAQVLAEQIRTLLGWRRRTNRWCRFHPVRSISLAMAVCFATVAGAAWQYTRPDELQQGVAAYRKAEYATAKDFLLRAAAENPDSPIAWFALACAQLRSETNTLHAKESFSKAYTLTGDARLLGVMAYCDAENVGPHRAGLSFKDAIDRGDGEPVTHYNYAVALKESAPEARLLAINACTHAIGRDARFAEARHLRGYLRYLIAVNSPKGNSDRGALLKTALEDLQNAANALRANARFQLHVAIAASHLVRIAVEDELGDEKLNENLKSIVDEYLERAVKNGIAKSEFQDDFLLKTSVGEPRFSLYLENANQSPAIPDAMRYIEPTLLRGVPPDDLEADWQRVMSTVGDKTSS